jgi:hypothetical protein
MRKNSAAAELGRKGGLKGGVARAARLTPAERSASASKAVRARWAKAGKAVAAPEIKSETTDSDTSDLALANLLGRLKTSTDLAEIRSLSEQIERVVFHKQFADA